MQIMEINGQKMATREAGAPSPRLIRAAEEFESQMMKELLKPMTEDGLQGNEETSGGVLGEFACEALGQAISKEGGFGIAARIIEQLSGSGIAGK